MVNRIIGRIAAVSIRDNIARVNCVGKRAIGRIPERGRLRPGGGFALALLVAGVMTAFGAPLLAVESGSDRPNVVLVMTDDQGYGDLSCHGNPVLKTPQLDELYRTSLRLTDYHVSPTCSPTRAALLTGHWTNRTGAWHTIMGRSLLREDEVTLAEYFRRAGYATGMFGKWHLGDNYPLRPEDRGFDEVLRLGGGGISQTPDYWDNAYFDDNYWHNRVPTKCHGFCTDVFFDYAMEFIREQKRAGKPFLCYLAPNAAHGPMHCPPEFSAPYQDQGTWVANFLGMVANIDWNVGRMRDMLREEGLADNTIFIFTTDNGTAAGEKIFNAAMRGKKGSEYDGGHRVPMFIHWPAGGWGEGRDVTPIAAHVDVVPTLLELCDVPNFAETKFDGRSLVPLLQGNTSDWPDRILVTDSQRVRNPIKWRKSAVMTSRWRLINGRELYDMQADPSQTTDVAAQHPEVVARLRDFYDAWWDELEPTFSRDVRITVGSPQENPSRLTGHDWITNGGAPWNQRAVRLAMNGPNTIGFWNLNVAEAGRYRIELRRWPAECGAAIDAALPPGDPVPGETAWRMTPGKAIHPNLARLRIGDRKWEQDIQPGSVSIDFELELSAGPIELEAHFIEPDGTVYGSYYAYVRRIDQDDKD